MILVAGRKSSAFSYHGKYRQILLSVAGYARERIIFKASGSRTQIPLAVWILGVHSILPCRVDNILRNSKNLLERVTSQANTEDVTANA